MKNIPNILTTFRILLIPFYLIAVMNGQRITAGVVLIISGLTDLLDGFLARRFNWITNLGKLLDPLADKLTQTAISLSFIFLFKKYVFYFWVILIKDALLLLGSYYSYRKNITISSAQWFGKIATFSFYITMICIILIPNLSDVIKSSLLTLVVILSIFAMVMYVPIFFTNAKTVKPS